MSEAGPQRGIVKTRLAALFALAVASSLALTGCSGSGDVKRPSGAGEKGAAASSGPIVLQTWGDVKYAKVQAAAYNKAFAEDPLDIKVTSGGEGDGDSVEAFRLALSAKKGIPDILQVNYSALPEFVDAGLLADVKPYVEPYLDDVTQAGEDLMRVNGEYVAFPYEVKTKLWFYRSDMFQKAGIDPAAVKTQSDYIAAGKKLQAAFPKSYMGNLGPNPDSYTFQMIASGNGARFSQPEPCAIVVGSDPGVRQAFVALKELQDSGVMDRKTDDWSSEWQAGLANGTYASALSASWFPGFLKEYAPKLSGKWGVTTWPEIGGAQGGSESAGSVFVIPEASKNKEAAAKFLARTLLDPKGVERFRVDGGGSYLPVVESVLQSEALKKNEYYGESLATAHAASSENFKIFPYDSAALKEQAAVTEALTEYMGSKESDPTRFLETAQKELTAQVGCPYEG